MDKPTIDSLAERVERLERENRRLRRIGCLIFLGAIVPMIGGASVADKPKVFEAERFVVRDKNGKIRAQLGVMPGDFAGIVMFDQNEQERMGMGVYPNRTASFKMFSDTDKTRATMFMQKDGTTGINFFHEGKSRLLMGMGQAGATYLEMTDRDGNPIFRAPGP